MGDDARVTETSGSQTKGDMLAIMNIVFSRAVCLWASVMVMGSSFDRPANGEEADAWGGKRLFAAEISAREQVTVTMSDGTGAANITFDIPSMTIDWHVEYEGLTSRPTGIHLHGPAQPGTNAVAIIDLGLNGLSSPISGSMVVSDAHVQYMLLGWTYVLLKTENYPEGELRGKLDVVPAPGFTRQQY